MALPRDVNNKLRLVPFDEAKVEADIHLLLVDHKEFKDSAVKSPYVIDTKGVWSE
mgnify:CR=1 FL=1